MRDAEFAPALLAWYDRHARVLPWRISPADRAAGVVPDPYRIWLSEVMLQQTTVAAVKGYFARFTDRWPRVQDLAAAADADVMAEWAGLGYYARARNLLATARAVSDLGAFPGDEAGLRALPGIGPYTGAAIAAIAFDQPTVVVDGNVERVTARVFAFEDPLPKGRPALGRLAARLSPQQRPGDFAQAMMDLGATICTPRNPVCSLCPVNHLCQAHKMGIAATLPRKAPKAAKPERLGTVYLARRTDGAWLLETRPPKGLLGGTLGWPGTEWSGSPAPVQPPCPGHWRALNTPVRHVFTHFSLTLTVQVAEVPQDTRPDRGQFVTGFDPDNLPTLMRKAWEIGAAALG